MRIAFTASGNGPESMLDLRFGRAANFLIHDTETGTWEHHANAQNLEAMQGAGIQAAQTLCRLQAGCLITGNVGPKAFRVLKAGGIKAYAATETTVAEALRAYTEGRLHELGAPNVEGHWI